jgi:hypothetical protein
MLDVSRRSFLRGALTVAAVAVVSPKLSLVSPHPYLVLYGDGVEDDAPALNAMLSGKPFVVEGKIIDNSGNHRVNLLNGCHAIGSTIYPSATNVTISGCVFRALPSLGDGAIFDTKKMGEGDSIGFFHNVFIGNGHDTAISARVYRFA